MILVILGKSICISGFLHELISNIKKTAKNVFKWYLFQISWFHIFLPFGLSFFWSRLWSSIISSISSVYLISHLFLWWLSFSLHWLLQFHIKTFLSSFIAKCFFVFFSSVHISQFCAVILFFHPRHNSQWPPTSKDFLYQILSITFIFLS